MSSVFVNCYTDTALKTDIYHALLNLDDILTHHAGPFATNAIIGSKWRQVNDIDEFSKDGIKILRHLIVSEDATARLVARMARFIGIAVDKRCHDGTTTSMLLFCRLARLAIEKMDSDIYESARFEYWNALLTHFELALSEIDRLKITEEDMLERALSFGIDTKIEDVRAAIAYHMAMISSKGDHDLSLKISEVIKSSPKKIYGMFKDTPLAVETEEQYILKKQEYDIAVRANIGHIAHYNYRNDTQYLSQNAVVFMTGNEIVSNSWESMFLQAFISSNPRYKADLSSEFGSTQSWADLHEGKKNLIILTPMFNDPELQMTINLFNRENPNATISTFNLQVQGRLRTGLNKTIHFMAGKPLFPKVMFENATLSLIGLDRPIRVHLLGNVLTLTNLYEKDGNVFHPYYSDEEAFPEYTEFRKEVEEDLEFAKTNISNPSLDPDEVTYFTSLYRTLTCQDIYDIEIGGSAHDQYANRTVYEDAIGAALSAVNEGVILGGYAHLAKYFGNLDTAIPVVERFSYYLKTVVGDSMRVANTDDPAIELVYDLNDKWDYLVADKSKFIGHVHDTDYVSLETFDKETMTIFLSRTQDKPILLQAWSGYQEQFKRFKDIIPRLSSTTHLIDMRVKEGDDVK